MRWLICFAVALLFAIVGFVKAEEDYSHGFATGKINWVNGFANAQKLAKDTNKPLVVLVHKTWCGACKNLRKDFNQPSPAMDKLVKIAQEHYVMVNLEDDESETPELRELLSPEGAAYIPRVLFFDRAGKLDTSIKAPNPDYPFFYHNAASLLQAMETAAAASKPEL